MLKSFARIAVSALAFCTVSAAAYANTVVCAFDKVTAPGMGSAAKTRDYLGEVVTFDTSKKAVKVEWTRGTSSWMPAEKIQKNQTFTSYFIYQDVNLGGRTFPMKIVFRLFADGSRAEVRSEIQSSPGTGRAWNQNAAQYTCA